MKCQIKTRWPLTPVSPSVYLIPQLTMHFKAKVMSKRELPVNKSSRKFYLKTPRLWKMRFLGRMKPRLKYLITLLSVTSHRLCENRSCGETTWGQHRVTRIKSVKKKKKVKIPLWKCGAKCPGAQTLADGWPSMTWRQDNEGQQPEGQRPSQSPDMNSVLQLRRRLTMTVQTLSPSNLTESPQGRNVGKSLNLCPLQEKRTFQTVLLNKRPK